MQKDVVMTFLEIQSYQREPVTIAKHYPKNQSWDISNTKQEC
jgi:hypothetical protein